MKKIYMISAQPLDREAFQPFGRVIEPRPDQGADFSGEGWQCWVNLAELDADIRWRAGMVDSQNRQLLVSEMERHLERPECVFALGEPVLQTVALSRSDDAGMPDEKTLKAFIIQPGQGVMMNKGVWHGGGLPAGGKDLRYLFLLGDGSLTGLGENSGWVRFADGAVVEISSQPA